MAIIKAPNRQFTGVSASVFFVNGRGETDNPNLMKWFKEKGYTVEVEATPKQTENETVEQNEIEDNADEQVEDEGIDADDMTNAQIKEVLDQLEVEYKSNATKDDLLALLESAEQAE